MHICVCTLYNACFVPIMSNVFEDKFLFPCSQNHLQMQLVTPGHRLLCLPLYCSETALVSVALSWNRPSWPSTSLFPVLPKRVQCFLQHIRCQKALAFTISATGAQQSQRGWTMFPRWGVFIVKLSLQELYKTVLRQVIPDRYENTMQSWRRPFG